MKTICPISADSARTCDDMISNMSFCPREYLRLVKFGMSASIVAKIAVTSPASRRVAAHWFRYDWLYNDDRMDWSPSVDN